MVLDGKFRKIQLRSDFPVSQALRTSCANFPKNYKTIIPTTMSKPESLDGPRSTASAATLPSPHAFIRSLLPPPLEHRLRPADHSSYNASRHVRQKRILTAWLQNGVLIGLHLYSR